jgi:hypothetical protein
MVAYNLLANPEVASAAVDGVLVYTEPTKTDSPYVIPDGVEEELRSIAREHGTIQMVRVLSDGSTRETRLDLTPYLNKEKKTVAKGSRVDAVIDEDLKAISNAMNAPDPDETRVEGSRSLWGGLLRIAFPKDKPVWLFSTGLDLEDPLDFRELGFAVEADAALGAVSEKPDLRGNPVTFVWNAPAGEQDLREEQREHLQDFWRDVLLDYGNAGKVAHEETVAGDLEQQSKLDTAIVELPPIDQTVEPAPTPTPTPTPSQTPTPTPTPTVSEEPSPVPEACLLGTGVYFKDSDKAVFVDKTEATEAVEKCLSLFTTVQKVEIRGQARWEGSDFDEDGNPICPPGQTCNDYERSKTRARAIAKLVKELMVRSGSSEEYVDERVHVKAVGANRNYMEDPKNPGSEANMVVKIVVTGVRGE